MEFEYDLIVIGAGAAGTGAALTAAEAGRRTAMIEKDHIGGTCTNYGCDPSKRLLHTAQWLADAHNYAAFGLTGGEMVAYDWSAVQRTLRAFVTDVRGGDSVTESGHYFAKRGVDVVPGRAVFIDPHTVDVDGRQLQGARILIAAGSRPLIPPIDGLDNTPYYTNRDALYITDLPDTLLIVGAGSVGAEFAQMFARFGVAVTLVEMAAHILPQDDAELAQALADRLSAEGIEMHVGTTVQSVSGDTAQITARLQDEAGADQTIAADALLLAVGRAPDLKSLNPAAAGVNRDADGWIVVDDTLRTNIDHIWAAGDITGGRQFTHVAAAQGVRAARNAFADSPAPFADDAIPWVTYTDPALAHVGRTADELRAAGIDYRAWRKSLANTSRAKIEAQRLGMIKLLVDEDERIHGGTILARRAGDMIAPLAVAVRHGLSASALADTLLPYPTWSAEVSEAAAG